MASPLRHVPDDTLITGWDFSTSGVKCLAFDLDGNTVAEVRLPTDLWTQGGVSELSILQLEGQARASVRAMTARLRKLGRLEHWRAGGISATHHTAGRIDWETNQVRRAICWNDQSLIPYHAEGLKRLGGQKKVRDLIGGPWAIRYSLSHLVKDEATLSPADWQRTWKILSHGSLAAGFLTGNFETTSVSSAASTGLMDLRTGKWRRDMLNALKNLEYRDLAWNALPRISDQFEPVGTLAPLSPPGRGAGGEGPSPQVTIFPTSDDQQAGLIGGGAVEAGHVAVILGSSAVVNSSAADLPRTDNLDAMKLNWGPYLWMRCYNNGAQFLNQVVGKNPNWDQLQAAAEKVPAGCEGVLVLPFVYPEPSLGMMTKTLRWSPAPPKSPGVKFRAAAEALAYLIALGVRQHEKAGQKVARITVSGGIARNSLVVEILASVLGRPLELLVSEEGPALGAAVTALAGLENHLRVQRGGKADFAVGDAVSRMVRFRGAVAPHPEWQSTYQRGLKNFEKLMKQDV